MAVRQAVARGNEEDPRAALAHSNAGMESLTFGGRIMRQVLPVGKFGGVRPYFICGSGHSGTTIIANILAGHPDVYVPLVETAAFMRGPWRARKIYLRLMLRAYFARKRVLVEKTPRHIRHLDLLRATVKNAKLIIPVRDGRDVAASIAARRNCGLQEGFDRWVSDNRIVAAQLERPDVFSFRYEDFVTAPAMIASDICVFLGVPFEEKLLHHHVTPRNWFSLDRTPSEPPPRQDHEAFRSWQVNQPIFDGRGSWRSQYTEAEMSPIIQQGPVRELMVKFGYI